MNKFIRRLLISLVLIFCVTVIIYVLPPWAFCLIIALLVAFGQFEFFKLVKNRNIFVYKYFGIIVGALIPIVIFMGKSFPELKNLEPMLIVVASLLVFTLHITRRDNNRDHLVSMALTLFSLFYISWFFSFFVKLRALENGTNLIAFLIIITKSADMGAYAIGSLFGRTELLPRISPKKTKEGTIGGILISLVFALCVGRFFTGFSILHLFVIGLIMSTLGQVGDLAESLIKRDCNVKDSGKYFPGIGGVLDLIDSLLFTAPVFYFYVKTF